MTLEGVLMLCLYALLWALVLVVVYYVATTIAGAMEAPPIVLTLIKCIVLVAGLIILLYFLSADLPPFPLRR